MSIEEERDWEYVWDYAYTERLGLLCGDSEPTPEQIAMARQDADNYVKERQQ
jgi:hypothetical protein